MSDNKPREFWIKHDHVGRSISNQHLIYTAVEVLPQNPDWIHVIEYSAYADSQAEIEKYRTISHLRAALQKDEAELFKLKEFEKVAIAEIKCMMRDEEKLRAENAAFRFALEKYADKSNWDSDGVICYIGELGDNTHSSDLAVEILASHSMAEIKK